MAMFISFDRTKFKYGDIVTITEGGKKGKIALIDGYLGDNIYSITCEGERVDGIKECSIEYAPAEIRFAFDDLIMFSSLIEHLPPEEYKEQMDEYILGYMPEKYSEESIRTAVSLLHPVEIDNRTTDDQPIKIDISALEGISISIMEVEIDGN